MSPEVARRFHADLKKLELNCRSLPPASESHAEPAAGMRPLGRATVHEPEQKLLDAFMQI